MKYLKDLYITLQKKWSVPNNRVIGHVVWSPPITGLNRHDTPNSSGGYTVDICVIELDANRFENWRGNVIGIDTEIEMPHFMGLMRPDRENSEDKYSEFKFPFDYLYHINKTAPATKLRETSNYDKDGNHVRFVIKSGSKTGTTVGRLNGYESHRRQYDVMGTFDSIETAVFPYGADRNSHYMKRKNPVKFAHIGDSGAVIVGDKEDFVAFITGGTGSNEYFEITYGTPFEWLWEEVIKPKFPDAVLFFDPIERWFY